MDDLIEALTILRKYGNPKFPLQCERDTLYVNLDPAPVTAEDKHKLGTLGFFIPEDAEGFMSFRFGSC